MASQSLSTIATVIVFFAVILMHALAAFPVDAQPSASAPAPAPTSDGVSLDQGIAYVLMFAALAVTYLVHPIDSFPFNLF